MELCDSRWSTRAYVFICGIFFILCNGVRGQDVTCNSVESDATNVFDTYDVTVSGATDYTLTYEPVQYGPSNSLPVGTTEVTVTALTSTSSVIGTCTFNVTVNLQELPIMCPPTMMLTVGTDSGQAFYTYPNPPFSITYLPESITYMPYGSITMMREYGNPSNPELVISSTAHYVRITISDGTLEKECDEALVTVEDREPPTIICPDDIFQDHTKVGLSFTLKSVEDNAGSDGVSRSFLPFINGQHFPVGTTTYTFIAIDAARNNASCSITVTVVLGCSTLEHDDQWILSNWKLLLAPCPLTTGLAFHFNTNIDGDVEMAEAPKMSETTWGRKPGNRSRRVHWTRTKDGVIVELIFL